MQDFENGVFWNIPTPDGGERLVGVQQRTTSDGTKVHYGFIQLLFLEHKYAYRLGWYSYRGLQPKLEELDKNKYGAIVEDAISIKHRGFQLPLTKNSDVYMIFPTLKSPLDSQTMVDTVNAIAGKLNDLEVFGRAKHERDVLERHGLNLKPRAKMVKAE